MATNVTATIVGLSGKAAIKVTNKIVIPDGTNGADEAFAATIEEPYDYMADIPFGSVKPGNLGMVKLSVPLTSKQIDNSKNFRYFQLENLFIFIYLINRESQKVNVRNGH